jgi:class 3 adenylate cyclase
MSAQRGVERTADAAGDLPQGVVTFLFTDIEGSTRLACRCDDRASRLNDG